MNKKIKKFVLIILTATFVVQVCTFASSSQIMAAGVIPNGNYTISNASEEYRYKALNADLQYWTYSYNIRDEFLNWTLTYNESKNAYKITQKSNPSKALGIRADSCTTFPELKIYTNSSSNYVFWNIVKKSDNTYTLSPKMYPNKYLSCYLKTLQTGTFVHFYISTKPQKWRIRTTDCEKRSISWFVQTKETDRNNEGQFFFKNDPAFTGDGLMWSRPYLAGMYNINMKLGEEINNKSIVINGMKNSEITVIEGNGDTSGMIRVGVKLGLYTDAQYLFLKDLSDLPSNSLSKSRCIIFNHCNGANPEGNFAELAYNKGAQSVIGFINPIEGPNADTWISSFFYGAYCSYSIEESMEYADLRSMDKYGHNTCAPDNRKFYGDGEQMLKY